MHKFIEKTLTVRQKAVLTRMEEGEELAYFSPGGWWIDDEKVGGKTAFTLLRAMLITEDVVFNRDTMLITEDVVFNRDTIYYRINEDGQKALRSGKYRQLLV